MPIFVPIGYSTVEIIVQAKELYLKLYIPLVTVRWGWGHGFKTPSFFIPRNENNCAKKISKKSSTKSISKQQQQQQKTLIPKYLGEINFKL